MGPLASDFSASDKTPSYVLPFVHFLRFISHFHIKPFDIGRIAE